MVLHGRLVDHQVDVGGAAVLAAGLTLVLVGLGARGGKILKRKRYFLLHSSVKRNPLLSSICTQLCSYFCRFLTS